MGRQDDLDEVARLLSATRMVTLTGTGGVGKTRLALQAARTLAAGFPDGSILVELAPLADPALVDAHVLTAIAGASCHDTGDAEEPERTPTATAVAQLGNRRVLLILDNCEHMLRACAVLAEMLLSRCPGLHILATSREPLRIPAETTMRVRSLSTPDPERPEPVAALLGYEAVRLFVERAAAARSDFRLTEANAATAARICRELDGIPLALELAAGRVDALSLEDIAKRLDDRFPLLSVGARTAPPRHRTLRGAVDWTYDVLSVAQKTAFHRLSVFAGTFSVEAAEHLWPAAEVPQVLDLITSLVDCSVLAADAGLPSARYRLPETMRQYARTRLDAASEADLVRSRLLGWATDQAEQAERGLQGGRQAHWLEVLDTENDNLRAALAWATSTSSPPGAAVALAAALGRFWEVRGYLSEGRRWLDAAVRHARDSQPAVRAKACNWAGILAQRQGDTKTAHARYQESLDIMRAIGDKAGIAAALHGLGNLCALQGDATARFFFKESLAIGRELDDRPTIAASLANLGWVAHNQGDLAAARRFDEQSLALRRELEDRHGIAMLLGNLGYLAYQEGDYEAARAFNEESLALRRDLGDRHGIAMLLGNLGHLAFQEGDDDTARALYDESLALRRDLGDRHGEAGSLANLAELARATGDAGTARSLLERALALARDLNDGYRRAALLVRLGRLAAGSGDLDEAATLYGEALPSAGDLVARATVAEWLEGLAEVAVEAAVDGNGSATSVERATRLLGAADALRQAIGVPVLPRDRPEHDRALEASRHALGVRAFSRAWAAGRRLSLDEAVREGQDQRP